ncbi:MAG TPA: M23 family metallopeptidase [Patescibacteria group bacterium]
MNPYIIRAIIAAVTFKDILKYVIITIFFIILLPFLSVLIISNAGIQIVSNQLVSINPQDHAIEIHDPTGKIIKTIQAQTVWPVNGVVTLEFGQPDLPYQPLHTGIDIANTLGLPITPFMKGIVTQTGHLNWGYGNYVVIDHGNNVSSLYGHMQRTNVTINQPVQPGDIIGYVGQTGWATGSHTHFEIRVFGIPVNPRTFIENNP